MKVDAQGTKQWDKRYGGSGSEELKKVWQLPSGRYILAGTSNSAAGGDKRSGNQGGQDYWVLKISITGSRIWDKHFGGTLDDALEDFAPTLDGGFLLGGSSASGISGDKTQVSWGASDYWLVRITGDGDKVWDKRFGGSGEDNLMALGSTGTSSGNFFLAGHSTSGKSGDKTQNSRGGKDFWMLKINGNGVKIWDKRYGGTQNEGLRSIILTADGGYLLAGRSESGIGGEKSQDSRGSSDYWVVKTNDKGVKQWDKRLGGIGYDEIRSALQTEDGGYLLGGRSGSGISGDKTQVSQGSMDYWLVKVAPETMPFVAAREITEVEETLTSSQSLNLTAYPNPASNRVIINFALPATQSTILKAYDSKGKVLATLFEGQAKANHKYEVKWEVNNQAAGMYLMKLQTGDKVQSFKILVTK